MLSGLFSRGYPLRALAAVAATGAVVLLSGCPQNTPPAARTVAPNATAPALPNTVGGNTAATAAAQQAANTPEARKIAALIENVDKSYKSGVQNYQGGRLDAARTDFDFAVDQMLTSGIDLTAEGPLKDEFERTVDAVNALELDALKQGNGFSPRQEQSPLESAGELTFPSTSPELTAKLSSELSTASDLPLIINDEVAGYINAFANSSAFKAHMISSLQRAGKYRDLIQGVLKEEGVPQDLIYLAVAESGFQPQALNSSSGAGGMWQFMPFKGAYGLERNGYFDERFDPEKSSRAYARYIKGLYNQFGDWYLAMAGYNWGPGNIQRAVMRTGYADFWQLYRRNAMPRETRAYVPQILAAIIMAKNPSKYGLDNVKVDAPVLFDTVHTDYALDLRLAADVTETTLANIVALNPALIRLSTPPDLGYDLHIPAGKKKEFTERVAAIPEDKRNSWRFHEVAPGETLEQIAQLFHASAANILVANGLAPTAVPEEGDALAIPVAGNSFAGSRPLQYTPRRGDTLLTIADRFNVTSDQLRRWNRGAAVRPGKPIYIAEPVRLAPVSRSRGATARGKAKTAKTSTKRAAAPRRRR